METLWQDLRYGLRMLARSPGFTAVAVLTLALGIGANTTLFSVVNALLLRPLPYPEADELVSIGSQWVGYEHSSVSIPEYLDYREQATVFQDIAAYHTVSVNVTVGQGEPERIQGADATASLFSVLGVQAALGRTFAEEEERPGNDRVVVLSHGLWQRRFGGDPEIIGRTLRLHNEGYSVVGVMPPGFSFPDKSTRIWSPLAIDPANLPYRGAHNRQVIARLTPGVSLERAQVEMDTLARRLAEAYPDNYPEASGWGISLYRLQDRSVRHVRPALLMLTAAVGFVLLIACANVANLLLARATTRKKEIAIRAALGARRRRLLQQLLSESLLLALLGGGAGLLLATWGVDALVALSPGNIPRLDEVRLDASVLGFALGLSLLTGILFGLAPAWRAARADWQGSLKDWSRGSPGMKDTRLRSSLVIGELAVSLVLLIGAGLMMRSFMHLSEVDPGFNPDRLLITRITLTPGKYPQDHQTVGFYRELLERLRALPGVVAAGAVSILPLSGSDSDWTFGIEGYVPPAPGLDPGEQARVVTPGYFRALGIPLLRGRLFQPSDDTTSQRVVVISQLLARKYWGEEDPLGKRIKLWSLESEGPWWTVAGIVGDVKHFGLDAETKPILYYPHAQLPGSTMTVVVRTAEERAAGLSLVRRQTLALDNEQPVFDAGTMEQLVAESIAQPRFNLLLLGILATAALLLAVVGIYGVISYSVSQRTHEIGIRMALGARPLDVLRLVVGQGVGLTLAGVALGLAVGFGLTRFLSAMLFGVSTTDPATFLAVPLLLTVMALVACYLPARRATRVDPMVALRYE